MQISQLQLYLLLAVVPSLLSGILVFALTYWIKARQLKSLSGKRENQFKALQQLQSENLLSEKNLALRNQQILSLHRSLDELKKEVGQLKNQISQLQEEKHLVETEHRALEVEMQQSQKYAKEHLQQAEADRKKLTEQFRQLSEQVLKSAQQEFSAQSREGLDIFLQPFRQQVNDFRTKVESIHTQDLKQREALKTELQQLQRLNREMTEEAHQLSTALKGQGKTQGNWGELILENVLDRSGLQAGKDYQREVSFNTEQGRKRPDAIIYLPDNRHLVIDAKVSLNAYSRYINAQTDSERSLALHEHIQAVKDRILELSERDYFELPGLNSPEVVFMFIPVESAFVEAARADESLFQQAIDQKVLVATPTTLLTSLNIVRQIWRFEDQNKHSAQLADQAGKVYNQLRLFLENLTALGDQLEKSKSIYETAMKQFISGRGNLVKRVEDFRKLGVSVKKEIAPDLIDKAEMELDLIESAKSDSKADL